MKRVYSATGSSVKPITLDGDILQAIGRLIRACSEIEDLLTLYLCELAQMKEGQFVILLGRTPVSKKVKLAKDFAEAHGPEEVDKFDRCFSNEQFKTIFAMRNAVAHGLLLGETDEGKIAFRLVDAVGWGELGQVSILVTSYAPEDFGIVAEMAEDGVPKLEAILKLQDQRAERRARPLDPHRKSQNEKPNAKP